MSITKTEFKEYERIKESTFLTVEKIWLISTNYQDIKEYFEKREK